MRFILAGLAFLLSLAAQAVECDRILELKDHAHLLPVLEEGERVRSGPLVSPGHPRLALGTLSLAEGEGTGSGRVIVYNLIDPDHSWATEFPQGVYGATEVSELAISPQGQQVAAAGGAWFGGPGIIFDLATGKREHSTWQSSDQVAAMTRFINRLFRQAASGDLASQVMVKNLHLAELDSALAGAPAELRDREMKKVAQMYVEKLYGLDALKVDRLPVSSIEYSPKGERYLINAAAHFTVRDAKTHQDLTIIDLKRGLAPLPTGVPNFFNEGRSVIAFHNAPLISLWDAKTGDAQDFFRTPFTTDGPAFTAVKRISPDARLASLPVEETGKFFTVILGTEARSDGSPGLKEMARFQAPVNRFPYFPRVAFTTENRFALGKKGAIEVHHLGPEAQDEILHSFNIPEDEFPRNLVVDPRLRRVAAVVGAENLGQRIYIFSTDGQTPGYQLNADDFSFIDGMTLSPDGDRLIFVAHSIQHERVTGSKVYSVDLLKLFQR